MFLVPRSTREILKYIVICINDCSSCLNLEGIKLSKGHNVRIISAAKNNFENDHIKVQGSGAGTCFHYQQSYLFHNISTSRCHYILTAVFNRLMTRLLRIWRRLIHPSKIRKQCTHLEIYGADLTRVFAHAYAYALHSFGKGSASDRPASARDIGLGASWSWRY